MHVLTFREAEALLQGNERRAYLSAQRDFLRFHLSDFIATVASKVGARGVPFYSDLASLAAAFCQRELAHVQAS